MKDEEVLKLALEYAFCFPGQQSEEEYNSKQEGFYHGYLQAKESLFTEQDMIDFIDWVCDSKKHGFCKQKYEAMIINKVNTTKGLLEIWKNERQNKIEYINRYSDTDEPDDRGR